MFHVKHGITPEASGNEQIFGGWYGGYAQIQKLVGFLAGWWIYAEGFWNQNRARPLPTAGWVGSVKGALSAISATRAIAMTRALCHVSWHCVRCHCGAGVSCNVALHDTKRMALCHDMAL